MELYRDLVVATNNNVTLAVKSEWMDCCISSQRKLRQRLHFAVVDDQI